MEELLEVKARIKGLKDRYVELFKAITGEKDARWIYSMNNLGVEAMKGLVNKLELELKWKLHNERNNQTTTNETIRLQQTNMNNIYIDMFQEFLGQIMPKDWLKYKVESLEALEEESLNNLKEVDPNRPQIHVPFGFMNSHWLELKESMGEGDELWFFTSDPDTWGAAMQGREGYVVLRNGEPTNCILTKCS